MNQYNDIMEKWNDVASNKILQLEQLEKKVLCCRQLHVKLNSDTCYKKRKQVVKLVRIQKQWNLFMIW